MAKRKMNSNSLANLIAGKNKSPRQRKQVKLMPKSIEDLEAIGNGSISDGIDRLAARLPVMVKIELYLQCRVATGDGDEQAEAILHELVMLGLFRLEVSASMCLIN